MIKELQAIHTKRKSFYNKAKLHCIDDDIVLLLSYDIIIITYNKNDKKSHKEEAFIFDSCGKDSAGKCGKEKKNPFPDYSKSLK